MVDEKHMREAAPHIERAHRSLEMLAHFVQNKEDLSLSKRVPNYYNILVDSVIELQKILLSDNEYSERMAFTLAEVSKMREYSYNVTKNHKGDVFYVIDAMLPLREAKSNILLNGRRQHGH